MLHGFFKITLSSLFADLMHVNSVAKRDYITGPNIFITAGKIFLILPYENVHIFFTKYFLILGVFGSRIIQEAVNGLLVFHLLVIYWREIK